MNYSELSDTEINELVAATLGLAIKDGKIWVKQDATFNFKEEAGSFEMSYNVLIADYCNNPSDAWPIILENRISLSPKGINWSAWCFYKECEDLNPLRAACIVFLMINEGAEQ